MGSATYVFVVLIATAIMASAVFALNWAIKTGQFRNIEKGATEIFDEEEPMGRPTDSFPPKRHKSGRP
ncbi:MAG: cbb3-type cytochrome oxidase assembly protein CcoS [Opitutaceae bacterium]